MELFEPVFHALHEVEEQAKESLLLIPPSLGRGDGGVEVACSRRPTPVCAGRNGW